MNNVMIRCCLNLLGHASAGGVTEVCVFKGDKPELVGYFDDIRTAEKMIVNHNNVGNLFVSLNPVVRALCGRAYNKLIRADKRTRDEDIVCLRWLFLDFDPNRPSGVSSTNKELKEAIRAAKVARTWLIQAGVPVTAIILALSGNGIYLLVRLPDYPNEPKYVEQMRMVINFIADLCETKSVVLDRKVFNPSRLIGALGAMKKKGDPNFTERPHRESRIYKIGGENFDPNKSQTAIPCDLLTIVEPLLPEPQPTQQKSGGPTRGKFDIRHYTDRLTLVKDARGYSYFTCPACDGDGKLHVNQSNGAYACFHLCPTDAIRKALGASKTSSSSNPNSRGNASNARMANTLAFTTLDSLLAEPEEKIAWIWQDTLPCGGISICAAKPKVGKSTFARNLAVAISREEELFGRATTKGKVLYLCLEEKRSEVAKHFRRMGASGSEILIHTGGVSDDALEELEQAINHFQPVLAIVDPLSRFARITDFNDYAKVSRELEPVIDLARVTGCHIMALHHDGKSERGGGDSVLGSTAFFGAVDTLLLMKRRDYGRTLETIQRYGIDLPETIVYLNPDTGTVEAKGDVQAHILAERKKEVLAHLGDETLMEPDLKERIGGTAGLTAKAIRALFDEGQLQRTGAGKRGNPYLYTKNQPPTTTSGVSGFSTITNPENLETPESETIMDDQTAGVTDTTFDAEAF